MNQKTITAIAVKCVRCNELNEEDEMMDFGDVCVTCTMLEMGIA